MLVLKHGLRFLGDVLLYSWVNEVWWPLPLVLTLLAIGLVGVGTQVAMPYIYTLF